MTKKQKKTTPNMKKKRTCRKKKKKTSPSPSPTSSTSNVNDSLYEWMKDTELKLVNDETSDVNYNTLRNIDVLFGRGKSISNHVGNVLFRYIAWIYRDQYASHTRCYKYLIAKQVFEHIVSLKPISGRFMEIQQQEQVPSRMNRKNSSRKNSNDDDTEYDNAKNDNNDDDSVIYVRVSTERSIEKIYQSLREKKISIPKHMNYYKINHPILYSYMKQVLDTNSSMKHFNKDDNHTDMILSKPKSSSSKSNGKTRLSTTTTIVATGNSRSSSSRSRSVRTCTIGNRKKCMEDNSDSDSDDSLINHQDNDHKQRQQVVARLKVTRKDDDDDDSYTTNHYHANTKDDRKQVVESLFVDDNNKLPILLPTVVLTTRPTHYKTIQKCPNIPATTILPKAATVTAITGDATESFVDNKTPIFLLTVSLLSTRRTTHYKTIQKCPIIPATIPKATATATDATLSLTHSSNTMSNPADATTTTMHNNKKMRDCKVLKTRLHLMKHMMKTKHNEMGSKVRNNNFQRRTCTRAKKDIKMESSSNSIKSHYSIDNNSSSSSIKMDHHIDNNGVDDVDKLYDSNENSDVDNNMMVDDDITVAVDGTVPKYQINNDDHLDNQDHHIIMPQEQEDHHQTQIDVTNMNGDDIEYNNNHNNIHHQNMNDITFDSYLSLSTTSSHEMDVDNDNDANDRNNTGIDDTDDDVLFNNDTVSLNRELSLHNNKNINEIVVMEHDVRMRDYYNKYNKQNDCNQTSLQENSTNNNVVITQASSSSYTNNNDVHDDVGVRILLLEGKNNLIKTTTSSLSRHYYGYDPIYSPCISNEAATTTELLHHCDYDTQNIDVHIDNDDDDDDDCLMVTKRNINNDIDEDDAAGDCMMMLKSPPASATSSSTWVNRRGIIDHGNTTMMLKSPPASASAWVNRRDGIIDHVHPNNDDDDDYNERHIVLSQKFPLRFFPIDDVDDNNNIKEYCYNNDEDNDDEGRMHDGFTGHDNEAQVEVDDHDDDEIIHYYYNNYQQKQQFLDQDYYSVPHNYYEHHTSSNNNSLVPACNHHHRDISNNNISNSNIIVQQHNNKSNNNSYCHNDDDDCHGTGSHNMHGCWNYDNHCNNEKVIMVQRHQSFQQKTLLSSHPTTSFHHSNSNNNSNMKSLNIDPNKLSSFSKKLDAMTYHYGDDGDDDDSNDSYQHHHHLSPEKCWKTLSLSHNNIMPTSTSTTTTTSTTMNTSFMLRGKHDAACISNKNNTGESPQTVLFVPNHNDEEQQKKTTILNAYGNDDNGSGGCINNKSLKSYIR